MRSLRSLFFALGSGPLVVATLVAQSPSELARRLDPATYAAVRTIVDSARGDSLPAKALQDKALEGAAKHVPGPRIVAAVRQLASELREARTLLRAAAPGASLRGGEIVAAADARRRGVPAGDVTALRHDLKPDVSLIVPLTVLGDLVQRGIPAGQARGVIEQLAGAGVTPQQMADIPGRMDVGLKVGAPPLDALRGALPIPVRAVGPPHAGVRPPKGRGGHP